MRLWEASHFSRWIDSVLLDHESSLEEVPRPRRVETEEKSLHHQGHLQIRRRSEREYRSQYARRLPQSRQKSPLDDFHSDCHLPAACCTRVLVVAQDLSRLCAD